MTAPFSCLRHRSRCYGAPTDQELTLGDAWLEVFQQALPRNQFCAAGKLVARAYREEFGEEPPCRQQFVDGAPRRSRATAAPG